MEYQPDQQAQQLVEMLVEYLPDQQAEQLLEMPVEYQPDQQAQQLVEQRAEQREPSAIEVQLGIEKFKFLIFGC